MGLGSECWAHATKETLSPADNVPCLLFSACNVGHRGGPLKEVFALLMSQACPIHKDPTVLNNPQRPHRTKQHPTSPCALQFQAQMFSGTPAPHPTSTPEPQHVTSSPRPTSPPRKPTSPPPRPTLPSGLTHPSALFQPLDSDQSEVATTLGDAPLPPPPPPGLPLPPPASLEPPEGATLSPRMSPLPSLSPRPPTASPERGLSVSTGGAAAAATQQRAALAERAQQKVCRWKL